MQDTRELPDDIETLKQLVVAGREALEAANERLRCRDLEIERMKLLLAKLRRLQFGRSSEQLDRQIAQLELTLEELEAQTPAPVATTTATPDTAPVRPVCGELRVMQPPVTDTSRDSEIATDTR